MVDSQRQAVIREANRVARWVVAYQLNDVSESMENIAKRLGVAREATVEKYLASLEEWKSDFVEMSHTDQQTMNNMINIIIARDHANIEPFNMVDAWLS